MITCGRLLPDTAVQVPGVTIPYLGTITRASCLQPRRSSAHTPKGRGRSQLRTDGAAPSSTHTHTPTHSLFEIRELRLVLEPSRLSFPASTAAGMLLLCRSAAHFPRARRGGSDSFRPPRTCNVRGAGFSQISMYSKITRPNIPDPSRLWNHTFFWLFFCTIFSPCARQQCLFKCGQIVPLGRCEGVRVNDDEMQLAIRE